MCAHPLKPYSVDLTMLRESLNHNEELVLELVADFLRDSKKLMSQIERKTSKEKWKLLEDDLHQFKGLVGHFDNGELYQLASRALETSRRMNSNPETGDADSIQSMTPKLKTKLGEFSKAIRQYAQNLREG